MENNDVVIPTWFPRINNTVAITVKLKNEKGEEKETELLGTYEGTMAVENTYPRSLPSEGLVRFIANEYNKYSAEMSQYKCFNPTSKMSRLCIIPLELIKERDRSNVNKPLGKTAKAA